MKSNCESCPEVTAHISMNGTAPLQLNNNLCLGVYKCRKAHSPNIYYWLISSRHLLRPKSTVGGWESSQSALLQQVRFHCSNEGFYCHCRSLSSLMFNWLCAQERQRATVRGVRTKLWAKKRDKGKKAIWGTSSVQESPRKRASSHTKTCFYVIITLTNGDIWFKKHIYLYFNKRGGDIFNCVQKSREIIFDIISVQHHWFHLVSNSILTSPPPPPMTQFPPLWKSKERSTLFHPRASGPCWLLWLEVVRWCNPPSSLYTRTTSGDIYNPDTQYRNFLLF